MVELIPYLMFSHVIRLPADIIYILLLIGLIVSINRGLATHRSNIDINRRGIISQDIKRYEETRLKTSYYGNIIYGLTSKWGSFILAMFTVVIFILLPFAKQSFPVAIFI